MENVSNPVAPASASSDAATAHPQSDRIDTVYPGHPCLIAIQIMDNFKDYSAATERTKLGWPEALSCSNVRGAGGAVYQGLSVLNHLQKNPDDIEGAFAFGCMLWERSRHSDFPDALDKGKDTAEMHKDLFADKASSWFASDAQDEEVQVA
ncbi:MAG: hypothetical protein CMN74_02250 [Sphingorhabdus sp.]|nr:hypothetical protein [Sphingorhabdus sp.]|tara:strand:- start:18269 stop:18721 length:453 start_codon:yes stop_codon:yes gene_type:complete